MPFYEYHCPNCHAYFSLSRSFSDSDKSADCPDCGASSERLMSNFSYHAAFAPDSAEKVTEKKDTGHWKAQRLMEDKRAKNPEPLEEWCKQRISASGYSPERLLELDAKEQSTEKKKELYGDKWVGREV